MEKILIVQSSCNKYKNMNKATGVWFGETLHFYNELIKNNYEVDICSIDGGIIYFDPLSISPDFMSDQDWLDYANKNLMKKIIDTKSINDINFNDYKAIYFSGGHGAVFDFKNSKIINHAIETIYKNDGYVCAVCHGVVALIDAKINNEYLVKSKKITGFSNDEENEVGLSSYIPFLLESELKNNGAIYLKESNWLPFVVSDNRIITGQNPASAKEVAIKLVNELKK